MRLQRLVASACLAAGLAGAGVVALDSSAVVGSTSDAGVVTVCFAKQLCHPSGPIRVPTPITVRPVVTPG